MLTSVFSGFLTSLIELGIVIYFCTMNLHGLDPRRAVVLLCSLLIVSLALNLYLRRAVRRELLQAELLITYVVAKPLCIVHPDNTYAVAIPKRKWIDVEVELNMR